MVMSSSKSGGKVKVLSEHIRKYLILYTLVSVGVAIPVGYYTSGFTAANKRLFSDLVILFAIMTTYPSMIQLKTEGFARQLRSWKPITVSLSYVFILSPILAFVIGPTMGPSVGTGFVVSNIVPASSASLGYVLIAGGSIELATALAIVSLVVAIPAIPVILGIYSSQASVSIPVEPILMSVLYILILPLIAGQITRHILMRWKGPDVVNISSKKIPLIGNNGLHACLDIRPCGQGSDSDNLHATDSWFSYRLPGSHYSWHTCPVNPS